MSSAVQESLSIRSLIQCSSVSFFDHGHLSVMASEIGFVWFGTRFL
jgi:hypothetical protein